MDELDSSKKVKSMNELMSKAADEAHRETGKVGPP